MSYAITDGENQLSFIDPLLTPFISMTGSVLSISQENIAPVSFSIMATSQGGVKAWKNVVADFNSCVDQTLTVVESVITVQINKWA